VRFELRFLCIIMALFKVRAIPIHSKVTPSSLGLL